MSRPSEPRDEGGFLSRWSRRKQQARGGHLELDEAPGTASTASDPSPVSELVDTDTVDEDSLSDEDLLARYELPDPNSLTASDDVTAFMRTGVPKRLRNMALRRVWRLDPVLANLDGLNDYDDDYTDAAMLVGAAVKTAYQVGKGGAAHLQEAAEKLAAGEPEGAGAVDGPESADERPEPDGGDDAAAPEAEATVAEAEPVDPVAEGSSRETYAVGEAASPPPRRKRMVFATQETGEMPGKTRGLDN